MQLVGLVSDQPPLWRRWARALLGEGLQRQRSETGSQ
jgi:hypothetical protein